MGLPDCFAAAIIRLRFRSVEKPQLTRKQCAAFGALVYFGCAMLSLILFLVLFRASPVLSQYAIEYLTYRKDRVVFDTVRLFLLISPPLALFGALSGLLRYQMKCGSKAELACDGMLTRVFLPDDTHWFQMLMAMPLLSFIYLPLALLALPLQLLDQLIGTALWGKGASLCVALLGALLTTAIAFLAADNTAESGSTSVFVFASSVCAADPLLTWLIFKWHAMGFLAVPEGAALPLRFSVRSLLLSVIALGAYLTMLANLFDW